MIFLILLYLSISSTLAVPTGHPPLPPAVSNFLPILIRENAPSNTRTIWNIIWSCLSTIFVIAWVAARPNIPDPNDSQWKIFRRRIMIMVYVLLVPEIVLIWAARQNRDARLLAKEFQIEGHPDWKTTHAYFLIMGGFTLYAQGKPLRVLEWRDFKALARSGAINWPDISEEEIKDKSKGDYLSRTIIVLQSTWFYVQFFARWFSKLAVTELEFATLECSVVLTGFIYIFCRNKPLDVRFSVPVHLVEQTTGQDTSNNLEGEEARGGDQIESDDLFPSSRPNFPSSRPTSPNSGSNFVPTMIMHPSPEQLNQVDHPRGPTGTTSVSRKGFYFVRVFSDFFVGQIKDMLCECTLKTDTQSTNDHPFNPFHNGPLSVPPFYSYSAGSLWSYFSLWEIILFPFFGLSHVGFWIGVINFSTDLGKWRIITIIISVVLLTGMIFSSFLMASGAKFVGKPIFDFSYNVLLWAYIPAQIVFLLLPLISLRALPPGAYVELDWASIFPHI